MKTCPNCGEGIGYFKMFSYFFQSGGTKEDNCKSCGKTYQVKLTIMAYIVFGLLILGIIMLLNNAIPVSLTRLQTKGLMGAAIIVISPMVPFLLKVVEKKDA